MENKNQNNGRPESQETAVRNSPAARSRAEGRFFDSLTTFLLLLFLWILLSGRFDLFHLSLGFLSCGIITLLSRDLIFPERRQGWILASWVRFLRYLPWLLYQIFLANLHVLFLTFHPRMMDLIDPKIIRFRSSLKKDLSLVTFANSITLTPGTITVYVSVDGNFSVHAIDRKSREGLTGEMEERISRAFGE